MIHNVAQGMTDVAFDLIQFNESSFFLRNLAKFEF